MTNTQKEIVSSLRRLEWGVACVTYDRDKEPSRSKELNFEPVIEEAENLKQLVKELYEERYVSIFVKFLKDRNLYKKFIKKCNEFNTLGVSPHTIPLEEFLTSIYPDAFFGVCLVYTQEDLDGSSSVDWARAEEDWLHKIKKDER